MSKLSGSVALLIAVLVSPGEAQVPAKPADSLQLQMRSALRALASAQEKHYTQHGTYSSDVEMLKQYPGCAIAAGVVVTVQHASVLGWAAESTHRGLPGESCVYWIARPGTIDPLLSRKRKYPAQKFPGRAICDFDPLPEKR